MTVQIFVKQEAFKDLTNWINQLEPNNPSIWLSQRVRLCTQLEPGWVPVNISLDDWQKIRDYFDDLLVFKTN